MTSEWSPKIFSECAASARAETCMTMGSRDVEAFVRAVRACYESSLRFTPEGVALR